jgi:hypothetical protein
MLQNSLKNSSTLPVPHKKPPTEQRGQAGLAAFGAIAQVIIAAALAYHSW